MKNVLELLERTAARLPRQIAFADQQCSYDYQTVVNIAESVGSALAANGDRNCPVAVLMERGAPCLVTLMGVLYSGNFYVVLDPEGDKKKRQIVRELRQLCKEELPEYVQPVGYKFISEMPLTPVGKVDYRKLEEEITSRDY